MNPNKPAQGRNPELTLDFAGRIRNMRLPFSKALYPLFEAVVNSLQAIRVVNLQDQGRIDVWIKGGPRQKQLDVGPEQQLAPISEFVIEDNGIGFTDANFQSFLTADSSYKLAEGAKGVGRFLWLKAFREVDIDSIYQVNGKHWHRRFVFSLKSGISNYTLEESKEAINRTRVRLSGFDARYRDACPREVETIGLRLVEHCLEDLILNKLPKTVLHDERVKTDIDLNRLFRKEILIEKHVSKLNVKGKTFHLRHIKMSPSAQANHRLFFCANKRAVVSERVSRRVPNLESRIIDTDGSPFVYAGFLSGALLDEQANAERTDFEFPADSDDSESLFEKGATWNEIVEEAVAAIQSYLAPFTGEVKVKKEDRVRTFVESSHPEFRPLLRRKSGVMDKIPLNLTDDALELELYRLNQAYDAELKVQYQKLLAKGEPATGKLDAHRKRVEEFLEEWNEAGMSKLAQHVAYRRATLKFLKEMLEIDDEQGYSLEESIHQVIFPLRKSSDDIQAEKMNLWIIDEKLAFHHYLASDMRIDKMRVVKSDSQERPDLIIFNRPFAFAETDQQFGSIVIIEFKRPMRKDFSDDDNPIVQVYEYVEDIKNGKAVDRHGRPMPVQPNTPFYAYIIADLTPNLKKIARTHGMTSTPDGLGFFHYAVNFGVYVEIISFNKLIEDSQKRNAALFSQLGFS